MHPEDNTYLEESNCCEGRKGQLALPNATKQYLSEMLGYKRHNTPLYLTHGSHSSTRLTKG